MEGITTFPNPILSLWQSAIAEARLAAPGELRHGVAAGMAKGVGTPDPLGAFERAAAAGTGLALAPGALPTMAPDRDRANTQAHGIPFGACAEHAVAIAWAEIRGNTEQAARLVDRFRMSACDPLWAASLTQYLASRAVRGPIPYRRHRTDDAFMIPLANRVRLLLLADWGAGNGFARTVLACALRHQPTMVLHLGDIYYSGTRGEIQRNFLDPLAGVVGRMPVHALAGNHDMYAGGGPYYELLARLGQPASYFCLHNRWWRLLALDTGLHDADPFAVGTGVTRLEATEAAWHRSMIETMPDTCRAVLLSHHPLFSARGTGLPDGATASAAHNPLLREPFCGVMERIALWLWGHEHRLAIHAPYVGLQRGRCIGAGRIPVITSHREMPEQDLMGQDAPPAELAIHGLATGDDIEPHCYAVMDLEGPNARVRYYQVDAAGSGAEQLAFEEEL